MKVTTIKLRRRKGGISGNLVNVFINGKSIWGESIHENYTIEINGFRVSITRVI